MTTENELGEAWFGCKTEIQHLKAVLQIKEKHILTLKKYIRTLKRKEIKRREKTRTTAKKETEKKEVKYAEKTLMYDNMIGYVDCLCPFCQRYLKTL